MANVVDPNSWRMIPPPDPERPVQSTPPKEPGTGAGQSAIAKIGTLSTALGRTFDMARDQVVWNFASPTSQRSAAGERFVRLDAEHGTVPAGAKHAEGPWLVIVENARDVVAGHHFDRLQAALAQAPQKLLVACEVDDPQAAAPESPDDTAARAVSIAARLRYQYVGPIAAGDAGQLAEALSRIKQQGLPTLLHLNARGGGAPPPHFDPATAAPEPSPVDVGSLRHIAAQALAELARGDERIVALSTDVDPTLADSWRSLPGRMLPVDSGVPGALAWCANLAASGSRPFMFLSSEEGQDSLGQIRREICGPRAPVTLVLEDRETDGDLGAGSSYLAGIRQLPHVSLVAPKDAAELRQMLAWCAAHDEPTVIRLAGTFEPTRAWTPDIDIAPGRCELLSRGRDVAIVAWGSMTAAAAIAAESLARSGIEATVINARFAQPLDSQTIAEAARGTNYVVLVDDAEQSGGFAGWVLEDLLRAGVAQPTSIVAPPAAGPHDVYQQCALAIFERCRWLAEPIVPRVTIEPPLATTTTDASASLVVDLESFIGRQAERTSRERAQVCARQLSSDVQRWVAAYEEVGSRDLYLWQWCSHGVELTTLPCVVPELRAHVCDTKMLSIVLCVVLDDVADEHGSSQLLDTLLEMTCGGGVETSPCDLGAVGTQYAELTGALWTEYQARVAMYPCYARFEPVLRFDLLQSFNTMRYSHLVNGRPYLLNMVEHDLYTPHNMMQTSFATLDLMCSPRFPLKELGALREAVCHAQCMGRIGNLLATWPRELAKGDFTSGVFARAIMEGDLTLEELQHGDVAQLQARIRSRGHESYFFRKWMEHRHACQALATRIRSLDMRAMLAAHDRFFALYLASQGLL